MVLIMTLAFFAGLVYHSVNLMVHSREWIANPLNDHLPDHEEMELAGKIYDRNGVVLAQSVNNKRVYNNDESIRRACLHIVGDDSVNIGTAVQTVYRSELTRYSFQGDPAYGLGKPGASTNQKDLVVEGNDITLTIDSRLQKTALEALGDYKGAMIFYNYKTGEILCMVSTPAYDPANIPDDLQTNEEYEGAYYNRVLSAAYPPGSTFKLVTASASLSEFQEAPRFSYNCKGVEKIGDNDVVCYEKTAHGQVDLKNALAESCNVYFGQLALYLGKDRMTKYAENAGFNKELKIDGVETAGSTYNVKDATDNQLAWSGVGQYTVLETPINMAMISAAIANGGTPVKPFFIKRLENGTNESARIGKTELSDQMMTKETADKLAEMMAYTVSDNVNYYRLRESLTVCAKTGTAEVGDGADHAWVTGFSTDEDCPLAFAVLVEHGGSGSMVAIPAAASVLNKAAELYKGIT